MITYVLNADKTPLMPCHPARARELVRKGRAHWIRRDTIRLIELLENPVFQQVTVGVDSGAEHIGVAAVAKRDKHNPRVLFRAEIHARPMKEIKDLMDERRSYRRGRRSRQWYRKPWLSPICRVRLSAKLYDKEGNFLWKIPVAEGKKLTRPDKGGKPQAKCIGGNRFRLFTARKPKEMIREKKPGKSDILVFDINGKLITWYDPKRGDLQAIEKRLLGQSGRHKKPIAEIIEKDGRKEIHLLSRAAEHKILKDALPNYNPPFRKFGQKRKPDGWLSPSAMALMDTHIHGVNLVKRFVPVLEVRIEVAVFDTQRLSDPAITGVGYQKPAMYARQNRKDFILARDGWKCIYCGAKGLGQNSVPLTVDHVVPRHPRKGLPGPDTIDNLVAACLKCQDEKTNLALEEFLSTKSPVRQRQVLSYVNNLKKHNATFHQAAHVGQIKTRLLKELEAYKTWGYVTKRDRIAIKLTKSHNTDAIVIASWGRPISKDIPPLKTLFRRRFSAGKATRRQQYKANPLSKKKLNSPGLAPAWIGQGKRARWVQQIGINSLAEIFSGEKFRLRDVVQTIDGKYGYVMKINSNGSISLSRRPLGKEGQFSVSCKKISKVLWKRKGLMEVLTG